MTQSNPDPAAAPATEPAAGASPKPTFEQRIDSFGEEVGAAGERFGRQAEAFAERLSKDATVSRAADTAARVWGLIILAAGAWFLGDVTLGYHMPSIPWADVWPIGLIVVGLVVVLRGLGRRTA